MVELLIKNGASYTIKDASDKTVFMIAKKSKLDEIANYLKELTKGTSSNELSSS